MDVICSLGEADSFPQASILENCSLLWTVDDVGGQNLSIFLPQMGLLLIWLITTSEKWP